jgi:hypothetical protein
MAGVGPPPSETRQRANEPGRGDWQAAPGIGWQHGDIPPCPVRSAAAGETWTTWFRSWYASHWTVEDLPNLRLAIKLWALSDTGKAKGVERTSYIRLADDLGITRKGQQDRRWKRPVEQASTPTATGPGPDDFDPREAYGHLRVVNG